jgi:hypothetical protein
MSINKPPKFPSTPVFIPAYWNTVISGTLTQEEADALYLKFPTGQGTESIPNLIVSGSTTLGTVSATSITGTAYTGGQIIATTYDALPVYTVSSTLQVKDGYMSFYNADNPLTKSTLFQITGGKGTIDATGSDFTFVQPPLITTAPTATDNSTKVPTTAWVNKLLSPTIIGGSITGNPLTLNFQSRVFQNFAYTLGASSVSISSISFSNPVEGGQYLVYINTPSTATLTLQTGATISGWRTTFNTNFVIPVSSYALLSIVYVNGVYIAGVNILT